MSLEVRKIAGYSCGNIDETKQDPAEILSRDPVLLEVFSYLSFATLGPIRLVSKQWKLLADNTIQQKIYREIAFGLDKWAQCCGAHVVKDEEKGKDWSSLPVKEYMEYCRKLKSVFPGKTAIDRLMLVWLPKTLNGQLTLKSLGELAKKYFSKSDMGYRYIFPGIVEELGDRTIDQSRWVVMTKDVLPGSRGKSYAEQQAIVAGVAANNLISFEVPGVLESVACILSQFFLDSKTRLFGDNPWTYTRCPEQARGYQIVVGGFAPAGLLVDYIYDYDCLGVAALRKF
jgi:hypothetical protein